MKAINQWPESQRPREKLDQAGDDDLSDAELLAVILRTGCQGKSAVDLARQLLIRFGGLFQVFNAPKEQLLTIPGIGPTKYLQIKACRLLNQRYLTEPLKNHPLFDSSELTKQFLIAQLSSQQRELFVCLFLNNSYQLIKHEILFMGSIRHAEIAPREIVKKALSYNAAAIILAHNHPSGNPNPSLADKRATVQIIESLALIDITVVDHIVVAGNKTCSFKEMGLL